jgi:tRNA nucleotidyltransferase (CCA-adding enzyme)
VVVDDLLERVRELPCGRRLLEVAAAAGGVHLVGGAVRDLLLGRVPRELDVVVEGDVEALAAALGAGATTHERFGTATVRRDDCRWDLAAARVEDYARPGALPDVRPAPIEDDLRRRDVTINAIALDLGSGALRCVDHALEDLEAGRLRVLHDASFRDDPTRLWRVARYAARLGFELEPHTARLAAAAVADGVAERVSGARIGNELRLALGEPDPLAALEHAVRLGLAPWLAPDRGRAESALELLPEGEGRADLVVLAAALAEHGDDADQRLAGLDFSAAERAVLRAAARAPALAAAALAARSPSQLARVLRGLPVEAVALAGATGAAEPPALGGATGAAEPAPPGGSSGAAEPAALAGAASAAGSVRRWLTDLRHVRLAIDGDDLLAAGVARGPEIGRRLSATLDRRLDGELGDDRAAQLEAALRAPPVDR